MPTSKTVTRYARRLDDAGCTLMLAGVSQGVARQLGKTGAEAIIGPQNIYLATPAVTESTRLAMDAGARISGAAGGTPPTAG